MAKNLPMMLATQVPMIEVRAAQALLREALQPALGEPESWRKARQAQRSFDVFRADVLRARNGIPDEAMQGQVFDGQQAKRQGLVDALGDLEYAKAVARRLAKSRSGSDSGTDSGSR